MTLLKRGGVIIILSVLFLGFTQCKSQKVEKKVPFTITEKSYFYWLGGKKGTQGTTIKITGTFSSKNLSFSKIYFQNHEYEVVPQVNDDGFVLIGDFSEFKKDLNLHHDSAGEYGNEAPKIESDIPFTLNKDEAVIVYAVNGKDFYFKVSGIKQLKTVERP